MNTNSPTVSDLSIAQIEYYMDRYEQLLVQGDLNYAEFFRGRYGRRTGPYIGQ